MGQVTMGRGGGGCQMGFLRGVEKMGEELLGNASHLHGASRRKKLHPRAQHLSDRTLVLERLGCGSFAPLLRKVVRYIVRVGRPLLETCLTAITSGKCGK